MTTHTSASVLLLAATFTACATPRPDGLAVLPEPSPSAASRASASAPQDHEAVNQARRKTPWEFSIGGAGVSNDELDAGAAQLGASFGYYANEVVLLSVRQNGSFSDAGPSASDEWNGASRVAIDFHLPLGRVAPYAGANFGYVYGETVSDTFVAGPEAGVKFYLQDDAFLQIGAEYQFFFDDDDSLSSAFDDGQVLYGIGLGLRF